MPHFDGDLLMKNMSGTILFLLGALFFSPSYAGSYQSGAHHTGPGYHSNSQYQRSDRRFGQHMPSGHEQRFRTQPNPQRNQYQQGKSRAGENQFGSGNTQMPRPPQMHQPGPAHGRDRGFHSSERRYRR